MNSDSEINPKTNSDPKNKPHVVCLPFPAQGHINPMLKLAILLHTKGFHITFVNTEYNYRRLLNSRGHNSLDGFSGFNFDTIPDGLPTPAVEDGADATQDIPSLCDSTDKNCLAPFLALLHKHNASNVRLKVSCVVCDAAMTFGIKAAQELDVPSFCLRTTRAASFLANRNLPVLMKKGIIPLKDSSYLTNGYLESKLDWIPSMQNIRLRDLPIPKRTTDLNDPMLNFIVEQAKKAVKASGFRFNTFDELECEVLA